MEETCLHVHSCTFRNKHSTRKKKERKKESTMWELRVRCCVHAFSVPLFVSDSSETPWTVAHQVPLSMGFSMLEYWSGWPCPPPGDLPDPGIEPTSLISHTLAGEFFITCTTWEDWVRCYLGANEDWSPGHSISDSREKLLQRCVCEGGQYLCDFDEAEHM